MRFGREAPRFELPPGPGAGRQLQLLPIERRRILMQLDERLPLGGRRPLVRARPGVSGTAMPARCARYRTASGNDSFLVEFDELDGVAPGAAPEALEKPLVSIDVERRRSFLMKRAESLPGRAGLLQRHHVADERDDVRLRLQVVEEGLGKQSAIAMLVLQFHDRRAVAAFVVRGGRDGRHQRMLPKERPHRVAQPARAVAVHDAQPPLVGEQRVVQKLLDARRSRRRPSSR